jgi:sulfide:quinone oxidoreductase
MARRGVRTHLGHKLTRFEPNRVVTEGGAFAADLILFMPGMTGNAWFDATELPRSPGGLVQADAHCRVSGWPRVYVVGDAGSFPGPDWMPKQAHMADLQAAAAAANLLGDLDGGSTNEIFKVELMCIIDALSQGTLIVRTPTQNWLLPPTRLFHWAKGAFERRYLKRYR